MTTWEEFSGGSKVRIYGMLPGYFMRAYVLGVRVDGLPSAKNSSSSPAPATSPSPRENIVTELGVGPISWKRRNGALGVTCTIPAGAIATRCACRASNRRRNFDRWHLPFRGMSGPSSRALDPALSRWLRKNDPSFG